MGASHRACTNSFACGPLAARLATAFVATNPVEWRASSSWPSSVYWSPYFSVPWERKNFWMRLLSWCSPSAFPHQDQSTDQLLAVLHESKEKLAAMGFH